MTHVEACMSLELLRSDTERSDYEEDNQVNDELRAIRDATNGQIEGSSAPDRVPLPIEWDEAKSRREFSTTYFKAVTDAIPRLYDEDFEYPSVHLNDSTRQMLQSLGLQESEIADFEQNWCDFDAFNAHVYTIDSKGQALDFPIDVVDKIVDRQTDVIFSQLKSLVIYIERFGVEEMRYIAEVFGIYNFIRYDPEKLHQQWLDWNSGEKPVENIVISAQHDWNGAFLNHFQSNIEEGLQDSPYYFEASSQAELGRIAVALGDRERRHHRDPESGNFVEHIVVAGHATPDIIVLGNEEGDTLTVDHHVQAARGREQLRGSRNNDYRRHLGSNYDVILIGCSAGGSPKHEHNIATALSDEHDTLVHASPFPVTSSFTISREGTVEFGGSSLFGLAPAEASRFDGTKGEGVKKSVPLRSRLRQAKALTKNLLFRR